METLILRIRDTDPGTVLTLGQGVLDASQVKRYALGLGRNHAVADAPFGVDRRVLFALLVGRGWLEIFDRRVLGDCDYRLRRGRLSNSWGDRQHRQKSESQHCCFHLEFLILNRITFGIARC